MEIILCKKNKTKQIKNLRVLINKIYTTNGKDRISNILS